MNILDRLKKGTSKLTITKLSYNAPAYVRAREQEIELMGIIEQQANQIQDMRTCDNCKNGDWNNIYDMAMCKNFDKCREGNLNLWQWDKGE